jgi:hypothetical protein
VTPTSVTANKTSRVAMELRVGRTPAGAARSGRVSATVIAIVVACSLVPGIAARASAADDPPPRLSLIRDPSGEGFTVPGTGLWLAGDVTITGGAPEGDPAFVELDDVSLLVRWEPTPRLAFFSETRLDGVGELLEGVGWEQEGPDLSIERLYVDALLTPRLTLRAGKFYTPFGLWNVIRRAPLTWTVEEPAIAEGTFPRRATGLSLVYQTTWHGWSFDATGYGPAQDELPLRRPEESGLMAGGRGAIGRALGAAYGTIGLSVAGFEDRRTQGAWAQGYGADVELTYRGAQLSSELVYTRLSGPGVSREFGFYLQGVVPITSTLYGVGRVEYFQPRRGGDAAAGLVGIFWRPVPYVILKTGYLFGDRVEDVLEPGFLVSVALYF